MYFRRPMTIRCPINGYNGERPQTTVWGQSCEKHQWNKQITSNSWSDADTNAIPWYAARRRFSPTNSEIFNNTKKYVCFLKEIYSNLENVGGFLRQMAFFLTSVADKSKRIICVWNLSAICRQPKRRILWRMGSNFTNFNNHRWGPPLWCCRAQILEICAQSLIYPSECCSLATSFQFFIAWLGLADGTSSRFCSANQVRGQMVWCIHVVNRWFDLGITS